MTFCQNYPWMYIVLWKNSVWSLLTNVIKVKNLVIGLLKEPKVFKTWKQEVSSVNFYLSKEEPQHFPWNHQLHIWLVYWMKTRVNSTILMLRKDYRSRSSYAGPMDTSLLLANCKYFLPCYFWNIPLLLLLSYCLYYNCRTRGTLLESIICLYYNCRTSVTLLESII